MRTRTSLDHETSLSFTGGFVYSHDSGLLVTADYYRIAVGDAIALTQSLTQSHGLRANARFQGRPVDAVAFWTNAVDTRTQGFDLAASWRFRGMAWGAADLSASRVSAKYIGSVNTPFIFEEPITIDAATIVDAEFSFRVADRVRAGMGANNLRVSVVGG